MQGKVMLMLSSRQFGWLIFIVRISLGMLLLPVLQHIGKGPDAWIASIIGVSLGTTLIWLVTRTALQRPTCSLIERLQGACGPILGRAIGLGYLCYVLLNIGYTVRTYSALLTSQPMPETPANLFLFMVAGGCLYAARKGVEVIGRVAELLGPLMVLVLISIFFLGIPDMEPSFLRPVLGFGWTPVLRAALYPLCVHVDLVVLTMMIPLIRDREGIPRALVIGSLGGGMILTLGLVAVTMFYSPTGASRLVYPLYDFVRTVNLAEVLQRLDAFFLITWTIGVYVKTSLYLWAAGVILAQLTGLSHDPFLPSIALLATTIGAKVYAGIVDTAAINSPYIFPWLSLPILLLPLLLWGVERLRHRGERSR